MRRQRISLTSKLWSIGQDKAKQGKTRQAKARQDRARQGKARQDKSLIGSLVVSFQLVCFHHIHIFFRSRYRPSKRVNRWLTPRRHRFLPVPAAPLLTCNIQSTQPQGILTLTPTLTTKKADKMIQNKIVVGSKLFYYYYIIVINNMLEQQSELRG
jgi:hypothetical protein